MKILHAADWHLDAPLQGYPDTLRQTLAALPGIIFEVARREACDLVLLSGDLFDGDYTAQAYQNLRDVLKALAVPVFIAPGNHDPYNLTSPWKQEIWPENVHVFRSSQIESVYIPALDCRVYGAGFESMDSQSLLNNFRAECAERYAIGVMHGDPSQVESPYNPVTRQQVQNSNLDYLALGHIHKAGSFTVGKTVCAWPGCPMGKGFDEQGEKGVYIVTLEDTVSLRFCPLPVPRFYDLETETLESALPPIGNDNFYRVTLTGCCEAPDLEQLRQRYAHFPNLQLRDKTTRPVNVWGSAGEDSFEGVYFSLLKQAMAVADEAEQQDILLAAKLSRQLLDGQEVILP